MALQETNISFMHIFLYMEGLGIPLHDKYIGIRRTKIHGYTDFVRNIFLGLSRDANSIFVKDTDSERTIGVNTRYIKTLDFSMAEQDKTFLIKQGRQTAVEYLKNFMRKHSNTITYDIREREVPKNTSIPEKDLEELLNRYRSKYEISHYERLANTRIFKEMDNFNLHLFGIEI